MAALCYSQTSDTQKEDGMQLLEILSPKKGDVILDLGCGTGYLANVLAERVRSDGKVIAVDPDEGRIKLAQETKAGTSTANNLQFIIGNDQDFPEGQYDNVFCASTIHWIKDKEHTFKRVYKYLKPEGKFGFTTVEDTVSLRNLSDLIKPLGEDALAKTVGLLHYETAEYYKQLAVSTGFEVTLMDSKDMCFSFPDVDSYINFYYGVFHGKFDRSSPALDGFRREHEGKPVSYSRLCLTVVLTKPS